jgi:hypothetical protein
MMQPRCSRHPHDATGTTKRAQRRGQMPRPSVRRAGLFAELEHCSQPVCSPGCPCTLSASASGTPARSSPCRSMPMFCRASQRESGGPVRRPHQGGRSMINRASSVRFSVPRPAVPASAALTCTDVVSEGDLNTRSSAISPDRGNHADTIAGEWQQVSSRPGQGLNGLAASQAEGSRPGARHCRRREAAVFPAPAAVSRHCGSGAGPRWRGQGHLVRQAARLPRRPRLVRVSLLAPRVHRRPGHDVCPGDTGLNPHGAAPTDRGLPAVNRQPALRAVHPLRGVLDLGHVKWLIAWP